MYRIGQENFIIRLIRRQGERRVQIFLARFAEMYSLSATLYHKEPKNNKTNENIMLNKSKSI